MPRNFDNDIGIGPHNGLMIGDPPFTLCSAERCHAGEKKKRRIFTKVQIAWNGRRIVPNRLFVTVVEAVLEKV